MCQDGGEVTDWILSADAGYRWESSGPSSLIRCGSGRSGEGGVAHGSSMVRSCSNEVFHVTTWGSSQSPKGAISYRGRRLLSWRHDLKLIV